MGETTQENKNKLLSVSKPGTLASFWHSMTIRQADLLFPQHSQLAGLQKEMCQLAFRAGADKQEAMRFSAEAVKLAEVDLNMKKELGTPESYLLRTGFVQTDAGKLFAEENPVEMSDTLQRAREAADRLHAGIPDAPTPVERSLTEKQLFATKLKYTGSYVDKMLSPTDSRLRRLAAFKAFELGLPEEAAIRVGDEVFRASNKISTMEMKFSEHASNYDLDYFLNLSPTFNRYDQGASYLAHARIEKGVDAVRTKVEDDPLRGMNSEEQQELNARRQKYGLTAMEGTSLQQPGVGTAQTQTLGEQAGLSRGSGFLSSGLGRGLVGVLVFLLAKMFGGSGLVSGMLGGVAAVGMPLLSNLLGGSTGNQMADQGVNLLSQADQQLQRERIQSEALAQQQSRTDGRQIQDAERVQMTVSPSSTEELLDVARKEGFDGLRTRFGTDERGYEDFLAKNGLTELANKEVELRLAGGNWLGATQSALAQSSGNMKHEEINRAAGRGISPA